jgi:hypothetical protein
MVPGAKRRDRTHHAALADAHKARAKETKSVSSNQEAVMALSQEARERFIAYIEGTDLSNTNPDDDAGLLHFVAWALVHEPDALEEPFAFQSAMASHGLTDEKMRYVQTIVRAAPGLLAAYEHERAAEAKRIM